MNSSNGEKKFDGLLDGLSELDISSLREQIDDDKFQGGSGDYDELMSNPAWHDLMTMLNEKQRQLWEMLSNMGNTHEYDLITKGRLYEIEQLIEFPDRALQIVQLKEELEDKELTNG